MDSEMINDKEDEVINKKKWLSKNIKKKYQIGLKISSKGSDFIFDCIKLLDYSVTKKNLKCSELYIESLDWMKKNQ